MKQKNLVGFLVGYQLRFHPLRETTCAELLPQGAIGHVIFRAGGNGRVHHRLAPLRRLSAGLCVAEPIREAARCFPRSMKSIISTGSSAMPRRLLAMGGHLSSLGDQHRGYRQRADGVRGRWAARSRFTCSWTTCSARRAGRARVVGNDGKIVVDCASRGSSSMTP